MTKLCSGPFKRVSRWGPVFISVGMLPREGITTEKAFLSPIRLMIANLWQVTMSCHFWWHARPPDVAQGGLALVQPVRHPKITQAFLVDFQRLQKPNESDFHIRVRRGNPESPLVGLRRFMISHQSHGVFWNFDLQSPKGLPSQHYLELLNGGSGNIPYLPSLVGWVEVTEKTVLQITWIQTM